jgi:long-chain acyl-CoA synthetase
VVGDDHPINVDNLRKIVQTVADFAKDVPGNWPTAVKKRFKQLASKSDRVDRKLLIVNKIIDTYKPFVSDNRQTFSCDVLVDLSVVEDFFHYEPKNLDWRRYWIDQHVPGLRRWSFPVIDNKKVELFVPKEPVRLDEGLLSNGAHALTGEAHARKNGAAKTLPPRAKNGDPANKKRTRDAARTLEGSARVVSLDEKAPEVFE